MNRLFEIPEIFLMGRLNLARQMFNQILFVPALKDQAGIPTNTKSTPADSVLN
jgi:hypothetical protein